MNTISFGGRAAVGLAIALFLWCPFAAAHDADAAAHQAGNVVGVQDGTPMTLVGRVSILDVAVPNGPGSERIYALVTADGMATRVEPGPLTAELSRGMTVALSGHVAHARLVADQYTSVAPSAVPPQAGVASSPASVEGTVKLRHADYFDAALSEYFWAVQSDDGTRTELKFAVVPGVLKPGMRIWVAGNMTSDGLTPTSLTVLAPAPTPQKLAEQGVVKNDNVLVILIKFKDYVGSPPFTQAAVETTMTGTSGVAAYWQEASFGEEVMHPTVTAWLTDTVDNASTNCNFYFISNEAQTLATAAHYQTSAYQFQKYVYLFPNNSSCGWAGLGDVGGPDAWSNGYNALWVIGHELGHTLGLGHDNAIVNCGGVIIGPKCANSQYGDPWGVMGNNSPTMHVNVWQKNDMGWVTAAQVATHTQGTATYTLSPLESSASNVTYGVAVLANAHRSYWLEFRQPVGFDVGLSNYPTAIDGTIVHLAGTSDYVCWDTCFVNMNPSSSPTDGALAAGNAFTDNDTGVTITAIGKGTGLSGPIFTVSVASPTRPTFVDVPVSNVASAAIESLVWNGITKGCASNPRQFCPAELVTREQLAIFVERAFHGWMFSYAATGIFSDVSKSDPNAGFAESIYHDGLMTSCNANPLDFCPNTQVTRANMAPILMKARNGAAYVPPAATGIFFDVPKTDPNAPWIEALYNAGITLGCGKNPKIYCPNTVVARDQMALFLQRAFFLSPPPP